jgi:lipopolysaccharide/colanic/teichoic acid biosynthesis glycosyltransferase
MMPKEIDLQHVSRCFPGCDYGHCKVVAEAWFTRCLRLERKRSERSRKPFILVLMDIQALGEVNGNSERLVHEVVSALASFIRETDLSGWYRQGSILGTMFTELGESARIPAAIDSIVPKIASALERRLGREKSSKVTISYHVFPEDLSEQRPGPGIDTRLYPDIQLRDKANWLQSSGKRLVDLVLSSLALLVLSPLLLLIGIAVKFSSKGPILYRQKRIGQFGKQFTFLKFRSMQLSNTATIHKQYVTKLITGRLGVPDNGVFKIQNDPRVTSVGRFLRKTSLDELPQLWNVMMGEMSLVGPRPPLAYEVEVYDIWHRNRVLEAKPGITGLWQVSGRSRTCFDDMVRMDLHYTKSSSLWLDLQILLRTPLAVIAGDGAY